MNSVLRLAGLALIVLASGALRAAEIDPGKRALIDRLMEQTGQSAAVVGKQYADLFVREIDELLKQANPGVNPRVFDIMREEVGLTIEDELGGHGTFMDTMYPVYDLHFTADELRQMIAFNSTPLGQKMLRVLPQVTQEGMAAGQTWGRTLGIKVYGRVVIRLLEEGVRLP
ncbi:MAG TPA: DUF2059 domain-containing protein [Rhodocyclaceae bacterium]